MTAAGWRFGVPAGMLDRMEAKEILEQVRDALTVRRVFGDPIERDGALIVPVAVVRGGGGGGSGQQGGGESSNTGWGAGWGGSARGSGVYVIKGGDVQWQPALDVNRVIMGGQLVGVVALLVIGSILRARLRRK
jgi:uncharacterized spore protein YtfJ